MAKHIATTTQGAHPWRAVIRTVFAILVAIAAMAPLLYSTITQADPEGATGAAAGALAIASAITRVLALPVVEAFLQRFLPWLAAASKSDESGRLAIGQLDSSGRSKISYRKDHGKNNFT